MLELPSGCEIRAVLASVISLTPLLEALFGCKKKISRNNDKERKARQRSWKVPFCSDLLF